MVREASRREKKYEAKVDAEVLRAQTTALKPLMVKGQRDYFPAVTSLEERVKRLVEAKGVSTLEVRDYLNYSRELFKLTRKFEGITLSSEAQLKVNKWVDRGLNGETLVEVAYLLGVTPTAPQVPPTYICLRPLSRVGDWLYSPHITSVGNLTVSLTAGYLYATPHVVLRKARFNGLGLTYYSTTGTVRPGLYSDNGDAYPSALLLDCGSKSVVGELKVTIDLTLDPGLYWVVLVHSGAPTIYQSVSFITMVGSPTVLSHTITANVGGYYKSGYSPTNPLPAIYPSSASTMYQNILSYLKVAENL